MPTQEDIRLGQLSVANGLCQPPEVEECLALQRNDELSGHVDPLGELLIMRGYLTRTQLARLLAIQREAEQKVTRIGPYELLRKLGEGGMGAVYQARDTRNENVVALKVLPRSRAHDKIFLQRFEQEARAAFELDHPNIIHGLDVGNADGYHFLVMEFVGGHDVHALLNQKGRLTEQEALSILEQVARALDHIHGERLVHRDIKPENILISAEGVAKLTDMGLAVDNDTHGRRRITQAGIAMGTPFYLSPEQIEGKSEADIRSDIYALGSTVYEMVTGRPPFDGETPALVMMKHLSEHVPSPHDIDRAISFHFCHLLEKMMAKDPALRYQTPAEMLADARRVQESQPPLGERPPAGRSSVSRPQTHSDNGARPVVERQSEGFARPDPLSSPAGSGSAGVPRQRRTAAALPPAQSGSRSRLPSAQAPISHSAKFAICVALVIGAAFAAFLLISRYGPR
jgi:serine/threonine-protein kinase